MTDTLTPEERSKNMSAIRSRDTKPEIYIRRLLFSHGYRYRIAEKSIPGHPDMYLGKYNTAIFVNGCFWHRHPGCRYAYMPKSHIEFWQKKFSTNSERDARISEELQKSGVKQVIVWECTVKKMMRDPGLSSQIISQIELFLKDQSNLMISL